MFIPFITIVPMLGHLGHRWVGELDVRGEGEKEGEEKGEERA